MLNILGYSLFVLSGLFFGLFGSGGSIIIIPILIYIFKMTIYQATTYSLLLVFIISLFGTFKHIKKNNINIKAIIFFIIPTLFFTAISRAFLFPSIPEYIPVLNISKESLLMILFSLVIFFSGISLLKAQNQIKKYNFKIILFFIGLLVGLLTGLLGIGGGFIVVPSLILFAGMSMRQAAGSALLIIMLNTFIAIVLEITIFKFPFNTSFIFFILFASILGFQVGIYLLEKINMNLTKRIFSNTLVLLSILILIFELF